MTLRSRILLPTKRSSRSKSILVSACWHTSRGRRGQLIGSLDYISDFAGLGPQDWSQRQENGRGKPGCRFSGLGDHSGPISNHFRRFRARPPICDLNIVILPQLRLLRHQHCVLRQDRCLFLQQKTSVLSQQQTSVLSQQQISVLSQPVLARTGKLINVRY